MGGFYYGHSLGNQIPSHQKPLAYNIIVERIAGFLLEFSHQMVFTDVIFRGELIYGQIILQVVIDSQKSRIFCQKYIVFPEKYGSGIP